MNNIKSHFTDNLVMSFEYAQNERMTAFSVRRKVESIRQIREAAVMYFFSKSGPQTEKNVLILENSYYRSQLLLLR